MELGNAADARRRAELDAVDGALEVLAAGLVDAVAQGTAGLVRDLELQVAPPDVAWDAVDAPVELWYGDQDRTAPVAFGRWWVGALPDGRLRIVAGAGHLVALTHWSEILAALRTLGG